MEPLPEAKKKKKICLPPIRWEPKENPLLTPIKAAKEDRPVMRTKKAVKAESRLTPAKPEAKKDPCPTAETPEVQLLPKEPKVDARSINDGAASSTVEKISRRRPLADPEQEKEEASTR